MLKTPQKTKHSNYYQKNKEKRRIQSQEYRAKVKKKEQLIAQKHYQANSIKVLLTLKEYTELNREKMKWTIQDCQKTGFYDIIQIQKLEQLADNLIRDYYQTAKSKSKSNWNSLNEKEQSKLIKYWTREKARKEQELTEILAEQERIGEIHEKELERSLWAFNKDQELTKFHEERGKIKCECWQCAKKKEIQTEIKEQIFSDYEEKESKKEQCPECKKWVKEVDEENGVCGKCLRNFT